MPTNVHSNILREKQKWKQPRYPNEWINNTWGVHTVEYYSATEGKEVPIHLRLERTSQTVCEVTKARTQDHILYDFTFVKCPGWARGMGGEGRAIAQGHKVGFVCLLFLNSENDWSWIAVMVAQICDYAKTHQMVYFKMVNVIACELYLRVKTQQDPLECLVCPQNLLLWCPIRRPQTLASSTRPS